MLSFEEIEDCFPDGACCDDNTGKTMVSAQWLHDFAHAIAAKEREAIKLACRCVLAAYPLTGHAAADCIAAIDRRSNV